MASRNYRWVLIVSTALAGFAAPAFAQSVKPEAARTDAACVAESRDPNCLANGKAASGNSTYLTPLVVSGVAESGGVGDPYATPKAVSTVGSEEINQFGGQNLDNVLRTVPGTFTHDNPQNPGIAVNIRGMDSFGRVTSEIDGARQNFRFTGHDAAGMTFVDPALLSGIDITRGAAEGVGGAGALAGVANFRTLEISDLITGSRNYGGFTQITAGNNGDGVSDATAAAYRVNDTFAILGAVSKRYSTNYANGAGETVPSTAQDILSGLVKAEITPTLDSKLTLSGLVYTDKFTANGYNQTIRNQTYTAKYDYAPTDNELIDLHVGAYYNDTRMEYLSADQASLSYWNQYCRDEGYDQAPPPYYIDCTTFGSTILPDAGRVIHDKAWGVNATNTSRGQLGSVDVKSTYGFEYNRDNADVINNSSSSAPGINPSGSEMLASLFQSTTFSVGMVDLTAGLRYDHYSADGIAAPSVFDPLATIAGPHSSSGGRLDPSVTLAINPTDWLQPYISYSETYRPPTVSELFAGGEHGGDGGVFEPNPNLIPELARTWEAGVNFRKDGVLSATDSLRIKADYFDTRAENYIAGVLYDPGLAGYMTGHYWGSYFVNVPGESRINGIELQAAYDAGSYFGSLAYTHTHSDLPVPDGLGTVSNVPDNVFSATAGVRLLEQQNLTLGGRLNVVGETTTSTSTTLPGYKLVDLFANYKFGNGVELGANVSNVFNVGYTPSLSTTPDLDPAGGTGRGRTFEATLKASF